MIKNTPQEQFYKLTAPEYKSMVAKGNTEGECYIHVYDKWIPFDMVEKQYGYLEVERGYRRRRAKSKEISESNEDIEERINIKRSC